MTDVVIVVYDIAMQHDIKDALSICHNTILRGCMISYLHRFVSFIIIPSGTIEYHAKFIACCIVILRYICNDMVVLYRIAMRCLNTILYSCNIAILHTILYYEIIIMFCVCQTLGVRRDHRLVCLFVVMRTATFGEQSFPFTPRRRRSIRLA